MATIESSFVHHVVSLDASASCAEAAHVMQQHGIGSVGVRRGPKLVGLVTERDIVAALVARGAAGATLGDAMRRDVPSVSPQASHAECAQLMRARRTRHLAVSEGGEIVGAISMLDLVDAVVGEKEWSIHALEAYIRGGRAERLSQPVSTIFDHAHAPRA